MWIPVLCVFGMMSGSARPQLPVEPTARSFGVDWLLDARPYEAKVYQSVDGRSVVLSNGLARREIRIESGCATVALDNLFHGESMLRSVRPEARITVNGVDIQVGGLLGQSNHAFLQPKVAANLTADPKAMQLVGYEVGTPVAPFEWKRVRHHATAAAWPPAGVSLRLDFAMPEGVGAGLRVSVHHELYDGLPCTVKWLTIHNPGDVAVELDRFTSEILAVVESESHVETRKGVALATPNLWVETDYAAGGDGVSSQRWSVHWELDPLYHTQVNYRRQTQCLLECKPEHGPAQTLDPGAKLTTFRSFVLLHDGEDRARNGLARCRMYRTVAPWVTENPLMMHVRYADWKSVKLAIDQCAEVGFEMVILTFGSGFNMEDNSPEYLAKMKGYADYAHSKGIEIGGYSLLSSRRIGNGNDVVSPEGESPAHGNCPALTSDWALSYYKKLHEFFPATGFNLLEHDGPYPGDRDVTARPPLQKGAEDSRWVQFWIAANYYRWCRGQGIYLNTPDWYHLNGSTKSAMGYREVNWSLPRAEQVLHTRQNIFDGTWTKAPSMGWMFVPLTEYQGGGAAATVEPLHEHLAHYRQMMEGNLLAGVQACYRGPRLYDTDETRAMVKAQVARFKAYRAILESDIDHNASRRPDGRSLDWSLHVNPELQTPGMLVIHNPLDEPVTQTIQIDTYYTGLRGQVTVGWPNESSRVFSLDDRGRVQIPVQLPAAGSLLLSLRSGE